MGPRIGALCVVLACYAWALSGTAAATAPPSITLHVSTLHVRSHKPVTLTGVLSGAPSGTTVTVIEYPYDRPAHTLAQLTPGADGSFAVTAHPNRVSWYRAVAGPGVASPMRRVVVADRTDIRVSHLSLGRAAVTVPSQDPMSSRRTAALVRRPAYHWRTPDPGR